MRTSIAAPSRSPRPGPRSSAPVISASASAFTPASSPTSAARSSAADVGASSADHLEQVGPRGIEALASAGVRAVLLPVASLTLRQDPPPVAALRAAGVRLVVASDANPGTAPTESLPLALALAVRGYGLTPAEALLGASREAAASLGLADVCGAVRSGLRADLALWDLPHENALVQPWGVSRVRAVMRDGALIFGAPLAASL
ncbi:MAG: amidohydrolase family protein [Minicystis sp.]